MPQPALIVPIIEEQSLRILWDDDLLSEYAFSYLRGWCPCAVCQGHGGDRNFIRVENPQLAGISMVGNYALNPHWTDGHETGIYTFEYLRTLSEQRETLNSETEKG
ncbi:MAG: gamma-butyrobetaine hydroxylase-like domain-containing protein [Candidatus Binatia bacterium]